MPTDKRLEGFIYLHDLASPNEKSKVAEWCFISPLFHQSVAWCLIGGLAPVPMAGIELSTSFFKEWSKKTGFHLDDWRDWRFKRGKDENKCSNLRFFLKKSCCSQQWCKNRFISQLESIYVFFIPLSQLANPIENTSNPMKIRNFHPSQNVVYPTTYIPLI